MSFLETPRFPDDIAYGSQGGPTYNTVIFSLSSGFEKRNIQWSTPRHEYDVAYGIRSQDKLYALIEFFHVVAGMAIGFRYKDFGDFNTATPLTAISNLDQPMEPINGTTTATQFRLVKAYTLGSITRTRRIHKPVSGTVVIAVDGVAQVLNTDYAIDYTTGLVTFASAEVVADVTWGGEFDIPVRFAQDNLPVAYEDFEHGAASVKLIEDKLAEGTPPAAP